jgi:hypothetical protein
MNVQIWMPKMGLCVFYCILSATHFVAFCGTLQGLDWMTGMANFIDAFVTNWLPTEGTVQGQFIPGVEFTFCQRWNGWDEGRSSGGR